MKPKIMCDFFHILSIFWQEIKLRTANEVGNIKFVNGTCELPDIYGASYHVVGSKCQRGPSEFIGTFISFSILIWLHFLWFDAYTLTLTVTSDILNLTCFRYYNALRFGEHDIWWRDRQGCPESLPKIWICFFNSIICAILQLQQAKAR